ncbi:hypothetical protein ACMFMG_007450 [Clarireedia jacksonii]
MPTNFLSLPGGVRNAIYELAIPGSILEANVKEYVRFKRRTKKPRLGLVLANKRISSEALSVMYTTTCFCFDACDAEEVAAFLEHIGRRNASFITEVRISFPRFKELSRGRVELHDDAKAFLAVMREFCKGLCKVTTVKETACEVEWKLQELADEGVAIGEGVAVVEGVAVDAIGLVDEWFRSLGLLREIVIELVEDDPSFVRSEMRRRGWRIVEFHIQEVENPAHAAPRRCPCCD